MDVRICILLYILICLHANFDLHVRIKALNLKLGDELTGAATHM